MIKIELVNYYKSFAEDYCKVFLGNRHTGEKIFKSSVGSEDINELLEKMSIYGIIDLKIKNIY